MEITKKDVVKPGVGVEDPRKTINIMVGVRGCNRLPGRKGGMRAARLEI